jgi:hypothetical protein
MKKYIVLFAAVALVAFMVMPLQAQTYSNTLYGQEGGGGAYPDGYTGINAAGQGPANDASDNYTNWKYQYGSGSSSAVYSWDSDAWLEFENTGDSQIDVECDIELYWSESIENNKIYFHIGNPFTATNADKTAYVNGTYASNHLEWVGISFDNTTKEEEDFETGGTTGYTGVVLGGMVGSIGNHNNDISSESFDIRFLLSTNGGAYITPGNFGEGAHNTIPSTLWWSPIDTGQTLGTGTLSYQVRIFPDPGQQDGNYNLDPVIVAAPSL